MLTELQKQCGERFRETYENVVLQRATLTDPRFAFVTNIFDEFEWDSILRSYLKELGNAFKVEIINVRQFREYQSKGYDKLIKRAFFIEITF